MKERTPGENLLADQVLQLIGVERSRTRAGFGVHSVGANKISVAGCGKMLFNQGVSAVSAFDFSGEPCVAGFLTGPDSGGLKVFCAAGQPKLGRDDSHMWGQD